MFSNGDGSTFTYDNGASPLKSPTGQSNNQSNLKRHVSHEDGNGFVSTDENKQMVDEEITPRKYRKLDNLKPTRPPSPPWKKVVADGPTSFVLDGRRKSSRTNILPLDLRPPSDKRLTRAAVNPASSLHSKTSPNRLTNGFHQDHATPPKRPYRRREVSDAGKNGTSTSYRPTTPKSPSQPTLSKSPHSYSLRKTSLSPTQNRSKNPFLFKRHYRRKSERYSEADCIPVGHKDTFLSELQKKKIQSEATPTKLQRIRLKVRPPVAPVFHPCHYSYADGRSSLREWIENDDPLAGEEDARITEEDAQNEAHIRQRLLHAAEPGGILSRERCSVYQLEPQEEPTVQYGHVDHLIAHAANFRMLMNRERRSHELTAKKLAHEARERWRALQEIRKKREAEERRRLRASQPRSQEEIWEEERENTRIRHEQLLQDLTQMWELVRAEVKKIRYMRWEDQQQALGKKALNEMLDKSTMLLDSRRRRMSAGSASSNESRYMENSDGESVTEEEDNRSGSGGTDEDIMSDPDNMSSSEESSDESLSGENSLSIEELRKRYPGIGLKTPAATQTTDDFEARAPSEDRFSENSMSVDQAQQERSSNESEREDLAFEILNSPAHGGNSLNDDTDNMTNGARDLDEVDPLLMDQFGSQTDDMSDEESSMESDNSSTSSSSGDYEGADTSMLGFLGKNEVDELLNQSGQKIEEERDLHDKTSNGIKPPMVNGVGRQEHLYRSGQNRDSSERRSKLENIRSDHAVNGMSASAEMNSVDPSSHSSLRTSSTPKPAEPESVSSLEVPDAEKGEAILNGTKDLLNVKTEVPFLLRGTLREYQHHGLDWLASLYANNTNGILADEMGLGKTIQTIALLAHLAVDRGIWGPHLVIVPTSVILNWEMEFKKWCPGLKILTYYGTIEERKRKRQGWLDDDRWNVCITSYQLVLQDEIAFKRRTWHYLILDEAHSIKNFQTQRWQKLLGFKTHARLLLTGTPLQNNLTELWSLMFFLMPSGFDQHSGFAGLEEWLNATRRPADQILEQGKDTLDAQAQQTVSKLHEVLRPYLLRRLKADVEKQMPAKHEHVVYCRLSKRQRQLYDSFMSRADTKKTLASGNYMSIINCLMSLRKVCNHPDLFETRQIVTSFAMPKSVVAEYEIRDFLVRKRLLAEDSSKQLDIDFLNLRLCSHENISSIEALRCQELSASKQLDNLIETKTRLLKPRSQFDGTSISAVYSYMLAEAERAEVDALRMNAYATRYKTQRKPIYGAGLIQKLTMHLDDRLFCSKPPNRASKCEWYLRRSETLRNAILTLEERSEALESTIRVFGCITPSAVTSDMTALAVGPRVSSEILHVSQRQDYDPYHEARIRLSIAFPDKRLLQFDCGKLQRLDKLLRELQTGGHRALIFTQMTKVLDILEQFLNIHGHRYLRLDGATKIEQRQMLTDQFNNDPRILVFILSSRSGGLGINLTGADTVIFYDLDWNPAMDKQCQDRCHRIGQTRDVHIYRFVSEHTIEANILRKSNQKRLLDDVIIQKGDFTTDYFNRITYKDAFDDSSSVKSREDEEAGAAMEKVLGGVGGGLGKVLESVEDREDTFAAEVAHKEQVNIDNDDADFAERDNSAPATSNTPKASVPPTPVNGTRSAGGDEMDATSDNSLGNAVRIGEEEDDNDAERPHVDTYMLRFIDEFEMAHVPLQPPPDKRKKKAKKGQEHRMRLGRR